MADFALTKNNKQAMLLSVESVRAALEQRGYIASTAIATAVYVAHHLQSRY